MSKIVNWKVYVWPGTRWLALTIVDGKKTKANTSHIVSNSFEIIVVMDEHILEKMLRILVLMLAY